jgi:hypothetical protein
VPAVPPNTRQHSSYLLLLFLVRQWFDLVGDLLVLRRGPNVARLEVPMTGGLLREMPICARIRGGMFVVAWIWSPGLQGTSRRQRAAWVFVLVRSRMAMSQLRGCKKSALDVTFSRGPHVLPMPPGTPVLGT